MPPPGRVSGRRIPCPDQSAAAGCSSRRWTRPRGPQPNSGTLALTTSASGNYWNSPLSFGLYNPSDSKQDFTVYEVCNAVDPVVADRTETNPCGTGTGDTPVFNAASNKPLFVTEVTPLGKHLDPTGINGPGNLCVSWEALPIGPHHKYRFAMVERTCNSLGATFYAGIDDGTAPGPAPARTGTGVTGVVTSSNPYQTFSAIPGNGGDLIANEALSHNFHNLLYVVDDKALGYPSGPAILYPENDGSNQIAQFAGCNGAVLTTGVSYTCP